MIENGEFSSQTERVLFESTEYVRRIKKMRMTLRPGDKVKLNRDSKVIVGTVCEVYDHNVLIKTFKDCPCDKCDKRDSGCGNECRHIYDTEKLFTICREYWVWYGRQFKYNATYVELLENGNK